MPVRKKPSVDRILEAAEDTFAKLGYASVSLRQLIAAAGVSTTAFYARFDSKEAVMAALVTRLFGELYSAAPQALDRAHNLEQGIEVGVELLCERFAPRKALVKIVLSEAGSVPAAMEARHRAYAVLVDLLATRIAALASRRGIVLDARALAWALVGALEIQVQRWAVWNEIELSEMASQMRAGADAMFAWRLRKDRP